MVALWRPLARLVRFALVLFVVVQLVRVVVHAVQPAPTSMEASAARVGQAQVGDDGAAGRLSARDAGNDRSSSETESETEKVDSSDDDEDADADVEAAAPATTGSTAGGQGRRRTVPTRPSWRRRGEACPSETRTGVPAGAARLAVGLRSCHAPRRAALQR